MNDLANARRIALADARRDASEQRLISEQNANLFHLANTAIEEVRALVGELKGEAAVHRNVTGATQNMLGITSGLLSAASKLEAIVAKYDAAIKEQIK